MGEGTLGVDELVGDRVLGLITCKGEGDVVAVIAPLGGVAQVIFHGVQVVKVGVQVRVHEEGEKEKGRGSAGGSKERGRRESRRNAHHGWHEMTVTDSRTT